MSLGITLENISTGLPILSLLILGFFVEKHYLSRLTVFANTTALFSFVILYPNADIIILIYAYIGIVAGLVGLAFYVINVELRVEYYEMSYFLYSSGTVGTAMGLFYLFTVVWHWLLVALIVGIFVNAKLMIALGERTVTANKLPLPVVVTDKLLSIYESFRSPY